MTPGNDSTIQVYNIADNRRLRVVLPDGYHRSERQYPAVYVLDERWSLGTVADTATMLGMQRLMPKVVIIGVGYQDDTLAVVSERRGGDYTPTEWPFPAFTSIKGTYPSGGADRTLDVLIDEIVPLIEGEYRIDTSDRVLFGHSLSGLCATWCFATRPGVFNRFLLASPSVWWDHQFMLTQPLSDPDDGVRLFVSAGELERGTVSGVYEAVSAFASRLSDAGHDAVFQELTGELHHSTIGAATSAGLRALYR
jgi:predicted alpha/beta superfamily hydrolase